MPLSEVLLRVSHDCPFGNVTRKFPSLKMFVWCNRENEVMELILGNEEYEAVIQEISRIDGLLNASGDVHHLQMMTRKCDCTEDNSVSRNLDGCDVLHIQPILLEKGLEYYRLIIFRHEDLVRLLQRLEDKRFTVEILRKVPFTGLVAGSLTLTADALFSNLTDKQLDALLTSYTHGYYQLPRGADLVSIASEEKVPRTTFEEHLKKAENKLITSLVPYAQLFRQSSKRGRGRMTG